MIDQVFALCNILIIFYRNVILVRIFFITDPYYERRLYVVSFSFKNHRALPVNHNAYKTRNGKLLRIRTLTGQCLLNVSFPITLKGEKNVYFQ